MHVKQDILQAHIINLTTDALIARKLVIDIE